MTDDDSPRPVTPSAHTCSFSVTSEEAKSRLDRFLAQKEQERKLGLSRSQLKKLIESGHVTVDGAASRPAKKLVENERVALTIPSAKPLDLIPENIPLDIYYEDKDLIVINKPKGLVVHPGPGHASGTLVNALLHARNIEGGDPLRPGIVHRLDKDTSGLMVVAKQEAVHAALAVQFHDHTVNRRYRVLVVGAPKTDGIWETLHGRNPHDRRRFTTKVSKGKLAKSRYQVNARFNGASELQITLETGRTHQVRVHCHDHGFPVLGDPLYSPKHLPPPIRAIHHQLDGQALHAELLGFEHPRSGKRLLFESPPPETYRLALDALKSLI